MNEIDPLNRIEEFLKCPATQDKVSNLEIAEKKPLKVFIADF